MSNRITMLGQQPGEYARHGPALGGVGQYVLQDLPACCAAWPAVPELSSSLVFDWQSANATTPAVGPVLSATGTPDLAQATPWIDSGGSAITATYFDGTENYASATALDPTLTQDVIVAALFWHRYTGGVSKYVATTFNGTAGWIIYTTDTVVSASFYTAVSNSGGNTTVGFNRWNLVILAVDRNGNTNFWVNGVAGAPSATPAGAATGTGICVGNRVSDSARPFKGGIHRVNVWYGDAIADVATSAWATAFTASVFGVKQRGGGSAVSFSRTGAASLTVGGTLHMVGAQVPRSGTTTGALIEGERTNKCYNNIDPQATTGYATTGGVLAAGTNIAGMQAAGVYQAGPNLIRLTNNTAGTHYLTCGAAVGNTNAHSLSVYANRSTGAGAARLGLYDGATFTDSGVTLSTAFVRTEAPNVTPNNVNQLWAVEVLAGDAWEVVGAQNEEGATCTSLIPNQATAATATRGGTQLSTGHTVSDTQGTIELTYNPTTATTCYLVDKATTDSAIMGATATTVTIGDGTATATATDTLTAGSDNTCRVSWGGNGLTAELNGVTGNAAYDGATDGTGAILVGRRAGQTTPPEGWFGDFRILRRERGT